MANVKGVVVISGGTTENVEKVIEAAEKAAAKLPKTTVISFN